MHLQHNSLLLFVSTAFAAFICLHIRSVYFAAHEFRFVCQTIDLCEFLTDALKENKKCTVAKVPGCAVFAGAASFATATCTFCFFVH